MKLKQIVCDKTDLTLTKEKKVISYGNTFEVSDERGKEILKATFKGKPVAEEVKEVTNEEVKETKTNKKTSKKENKNEN